MSLNWKEIDLILKELDLTGGHIQKIRQSDYQKIIFNIYKPGDIATEKAFALLICLKQGATRIHRLTEKPVSMNKPPRFTEHLRSRIKGGRIIEASQLGQERIVKLLIRKGDQHTTLWIRLWGGASNVIVTESDGTILDALFRRPKRDEISGGHYSPEAESLQKARKPGEEKEYMVRNFPESLTFNEAIEKNYQAEEQDDRTARLLEQAEKGHRQRLNRLHFNLVSLEKKLNLYQDPEHYKLWGDLVLAEIHRIEKGSRWLETKDYTRDNAVVRIELDPTLNPRENASAFYSKYKKAKSGRTILFDEIENTKAQIRNEEKKYRDLVEGPDLNEIESYIQRNRSTNRSEEKKATPGLRFFSSDFTILVGRTAKDNDELLRHHVRGNDLWLHVRDYPGSYVFIKTKPKKSVPLDTLLDAGNLAMFYSKARKSLQAELYYTSVKYLRRIREGKKGLVIPTQEKNLSIRLDPQRLEKLMADI
jgi:predicted ribosome quality control (RQC) complex YloA/Tae2 family protein